MDDLISRQDAIDALNGNITVTGEANAMAVQGYIWSVSLKIKELPSAQPERKTGKWLRTDKYDINGNKGWKCSCCGNITACNGVYCHACGAKMKGVEQEKRTDE